MKTPQPKPRAEWEKEFESKFYDIRKGYFQCAEDFDDVRDFIRSLLSRREQEVERETVRKIFRKWIKFGTDMYGFNKWIHELHDQAIEAVKMN